MATDVIGNGQDLAEVGERVWIFICILTLELENAFLEGQGQEKALRMSRSLCSTGRQRR